MDIVERFIKYVKVDTQSAEDAATFPSTGGQLELGRMLVKDMQDMGIADAHMDQYGYVMGTIPANTEQQVPVIGLLAHMDTSPDLTGHDVKPRIITYQGGDIVLNEARGVVMEAANFPSLSRQIGEELIVTDGTTLLGGDDKAGIAAILTMAEVLLQDPTIKHGTIKIAFTPDEEVGTGVDHFDVVAFGADYAYTVDGQEIGELEYETFNAASARVKVQGYSIHPGAAKNRMKNSAEIGMEFHSMLPAQEKPQFTEGREGFFHLTHMSGNVDHTEMGYIIRDHDRRIFEKRKALMQDAAAFINQKYGAGTLELTVEDSYYNMREQIEPHMEIVDRAKALMLEMGIAPKIAPVRGGTDGSRLSFMGLPCPNLFTGGYNCHGQYEYVCISELKACAKFLQALMMEQVEQ